MTPAQKARREHAAATRARLESDAITFLCAHGYEGPVADIGLAEFGGTSVSRPGGSGWVVVHLDVTAQRWRVDLGLRRGRNHTLRVPVGENCAVLEIALREVG